MRREEPHHNWLSWCISVATVFFVSASQYLVSTTFQSYTTVYFYMHLLFCALLGMAVLWGGDILTCCQKWRVSFRFLWLNFLGSQQWFSAPRELSLWEAKTHLSTCRPSFICHCICICFICRHAIQTSANVPQFNEIWWSTFLTLQYYSTFVGKWAKPVIHAV